MPHTCLRTTFAELLRTGILGEIVRSVFTELKSDFTRLSNAVFGKTGCNSTGEAMYAEVWNNYINGKYLQFRYPIVTQYVFKLWCTHKATGELPKYCTKDIIAKAQVRMGVGSAEQMSMMTTPRNSKGAGSTPSSASSVLLTSPPPGDHHTIMLERAAAWFAVEDQRQRAAAAAAAAVSAETEATLQEVGLDARRCGTAAAAAVAVLTLHRRLLNW